MLNIEKARSKCFGPFSCVHLAHSLLLLHDFACKLLVLLRNDEKVNTTLLRAYINLVLVRAIEVVENLFVNLAPHLVENQHARA